VLVHFLNDHEMGGPTRPETWEAAYQVAFHVLGLSRRHPLSPYVLHVYPDVLPEAQGRRETREVGGQEARETR
jgi:hypothetical protein